MIRLRDDYKGVEVRKLLGLSEIAFKMLQRRGGIAYHMRGVRHFYCVPYIDKLVDMWNEYPPELRNACDSAYFKLCTLQWEYEHPPADCQTQRKRRAHRKQIREECKRLVRIGRAYDPAAFAKALGKEPDSIRYWAKVKKLLTVRIGPQYYMSARYAKHMLAPFLHMCTVADIAEQTGLAEGTINSIIRRGAPAVKCVDGLWRIDPEDLAYFARPEADETGDRLVTIAETAHRLGFDVTVITWEISEDRIKSVGWRATRRIPESEVQRWEEYFAHLNPAFAWLEPIVMLQGVKPRTIGAKIVQRELDLRASTLSKWCEDGLLPYFARSFSMRCGREHRLFVRRYVMGLKAFAGGAKITRRVGRAYLAHCKRNTQIM